MTPGAGWWFWVVAVGLCASSLGGGLLARAAESGDAVVVIYNTRLPGSKALAEYYAHRRGVPSEQVLGLDLPTGETMTRTEFVQGLQQPLWKWLEAERLFTLAPAPPPATGQEKRPANARQVVAARIRYAVLCHGVPVKVLRDAELVEEGPEQSRPELRRNEGSVDSDLACLPLTEMGLRWTGVINNPLYATTNATWLHPTNGLLLVTRLDGPSSAIARGLIDKALEAETNGLWGRAYIDARGITNGGYFLGDDWMRKAARITRQVGYETLLDESPATFSASQPLSHIAIYAGWYEGHVCGPFTRPEVEFMPGAFAYHLHSFSAQSIRTADAHWVGPLLAKGATVTLGCVEEPYLQGTPDIAAFLFRFLALGFSFGEAAYAAQNSLSWQNIAVGDPLYRPTLRSADDLRADLEARLSPWREWFHLRLVNFNEANGTDLEDLISYLEKLVLTRQSAVLTEKLADLCWAKRRVIDALDYYEAALRRKPSPQQKVRLLLTLAQRKTTDQATYAMYERLVREVPDYPDLPSIHQKLAGLARSLGKADDATRWEELLKPPSPKEAEP